MGGAELLLAFLVLAIVRDRPVASSQPGPAAQSGGLSSVLASPQVWINAIYATSISLVYVAFGGLWGTPYIQKVYNLDTVAAAGTGNYLFVGGIVGSLFFGWISDYLGKRKLPMVLAGVGALVTMTGLLYISGLPLVAFKAGLFSGGMFQQREHHFVRCGPRSLSQDGGFFHRVLEHVLFCRECGVSAVGGDVAGKEQFRRPKRGAGGIDCGGLSLCVIATGDIHAGGVDRVGVTQRNFDWGRAAEGYGARAART